MKFKYRVRAADGNIQEGQLEAESQGLALQALRERGVMVLSMSAAEAGSKEGGGARLSFFEKLQRIGTVPAKTKMVFFRQMATMVQAGLTLSMAIDIIAEQERSMVFKDVLIDVKGRLDRGIPMSQAMKVHPSIFNNMMISLVQAGEEGGLLDDSLERVAGLLEKQAALRSKIRSAMFYPSFVIFFALAVVVVFIAFILPKFQQVFRGMNIELPALTEILFSLGEYCTEHWLGIVIWTLAVVGVLVFLLKSSTTKPMMDRVKLKLPVIKSLVFKSGMARATQTLAALVTAGVPILRGLEMAEGAAGNEVIRQGFADLQASAKQGVHLGDAAKRAKVFPILVCQMMRIGEETGHLDEMLERVARWYDQELDEQIKAMTSLIEPIMIIFVGGIVAVIAMAIFGPITAAMSQMG
ncbi:type II secretion system F family protein [uncultured Fretibacterium sp.]|uniref:type II secretion system F family protein n=1 Tax=uncultured Fretibacterium sp. TaxID=1678694 RepID=UPI0026100D79|nr:type II secretion system F family protein [uncultured Fretibacterium sp.]